MKLFLLDDPMMPARFAMPACIGTWSDGDVCKACGQHTQRLIEPLLVEWEPGTDIIGDFSWACYTGIVKESTRARLSALGFECDWSEVIVRPPTTKGRRRRVKYPYDGPPLYWLKPTVELPLNIMASRLKVESDCPTCGTMKYRFRRTGLVINRHDWHGEKVFLIQQLEPSGATFVTEESLKILKGAKFTNLRPLLAGEIVDA